MLLRSRGAPAWRHKRAMPCKVQILARLSFIIITKGNMLYKIFCFIIISYLDKKFIDANFWNKTKANWYTKAKFKKIEFWRYKNYISIWNKVYDYWNFYKCDCVEVEFLWKTMTFVDWVKIPWNWMDAIEKYLWNEWLAKYARYIWQDIDTRNKKARNQ